MKACLGIGAMLAASLYPTLAGYMHVMSGVVTARPGATTWDVTELSNRKLLRTRLVSLKNSSVSLQVLSSSLGRIVCPPVCHIGANSCEPPCRLSLQMCQRMHRSGCMRILA